MQQVNVGLVGFGTVGSGVAKVLIEQTDALTERTGIRFDLRRVVDVDLERERDVTLGEDILSNRLEDVLEDADVQTVITLMGGTTTARETVLRLLDAGKSIVTANKALLALHGGEILRKAREKGVSVSFEAAVCGGIPIVLALRDGLVGNRIESIVGIVNGTANFILTGMKKRGLTYADALAEAQRLGYAEADPTLDVGGGDSAHKLAILAHLGFGIDFDFEQVYTEGITHLDVSDIRNAADLGYEVKLLAIGRRTDRGVELRVHPAMIAGQHPLAWVDGPMNAVFVTGNNVGPLLFHGQGAGQMPTASAVISDLVDAAVGKAKVTFNQFRYLPGRTQRGKVRPIDRHRGSYYLRFTAKDQPGVLAQIAGCLGRHDISILSVVQRESRARAGSASIVMMTDVAEEANLRQAVSEVDRMDVVHDKTVWIRVER